MKPPFWLNGDIILSLINILAVLMGFFWFRFRLKIARKEKILFWGLVPSTIYGAEDAQKMLRLDTRFYYIYSILLNLGVQTIIRFELEINLLLFIVPTILQIALFMLILQTYRQVFALSGAIRRNALLGIGFFFWILFFFLLGLEQIIRFPIFFGTFIMMITRNENVFFYGSSVYSWFVSITYLMLGISGEYLLKRVFLNTRKIDHFQEM
ncbi:MAG: hypothetical protein Q8R20_02070 [Nanoarchaeota archaeon]|nr:hypothetical protein [Nanoarchaeota archaeon]